MEKAVSVSSSPGGKSCHRGPFRHPQTKKPLTDEERLRYGRDVEIRYTPWRETGKYSGADLRFLRGKKGGRGVGRPPKRSG